MGLHDFKDIGFGECVCDKDGRVVSQNKYCQDLCKNQIGNICKDGCREFVTLECTDVFTVKTNKDVYNKRHNITSFKNDTFQTICLYPHLREFPLINFDILTKKESEIALLMSKGFSNLEIVQKLRIAKATLKTHINHIYQKIEKDIFDYRNKHNK